MESSRRTVLPIALVAVLLVSLAALQYRWIGELSRAEEQQMREGLDRAAQRFAGELDREVGEVLWALRPFPGDGRDGQDPVGLGVELWRSRARHPQLLRDVWALSSTETGLRLERLDEPQRTWRQVDSWPPDLQAIRTRLVPGRLRFEMPVMADIPALVVPRVAERPPGRERGPRWATARLEGVLIARLDRDVITSELLPELVERYFGDGDYDLAVVDADGRELYSSDPSRPLAELLRADARVPLLLAPRMAERHLRRGSGPGAPPPRPGREPGELGPRGDRPRGPGEPPGSERPGPFVRPVPGANGDRGDEPPPERASWQLLARHSAGSLAQAVGRARLRNLFASGGVLLLLGVAAGLLVGAARRAERLARQQMEFVAGVTHELHTPLAAICSAGSNLADGVVADPDRVRGYGRMIRSEGQRLSHTVDQVLDFAGIQSGGRAYEMQPVDVAALVEAVLAQNALVLQESGLQLQRDVAPDLPPVDGDEAALRRALDNLVTNAARHGRTGGWLGVSARLATGGGAVEIGVADRGPGVAPADRGRLFEPFFRGRSEGAAAGRGTGLGLSIVRHVVEAHGGGVRLEAPVGGGARFVLRLPVRRAAGSAG